MRFWRVCGVLAGVRGAGGLSYDGAGVSAGGERARAGRPAREPAQAAETYSMLAPQRKPRRSGAPT